MIRNIGQRIRLIRTNKGISLNEFAELIGVSSGYLSNLENGKTDTIQLSLLDKLQSNYSLLPIESKTTDELDNRINHIKHQLHRLNSNNPEGTEFLIATIEHGLDLLLKKKE